MAAARSLVGKLLQLQGNTSAHRLSAIGVGFFGAAAVASAASDEGGACPAYPWPHDGARGGPKVFMQHDCAACHTSLPYAGLRGAAGGQVEAKAAEIVVADEEAQPAMARLLHGGAYPPDLTLIKKCWRGCATTSCTAPRN
uniref:Cytochrome c domain-containing protein n=1 Tax=Arundo donax TaxID=35708 RepID=A0A0A9CT08_ARUDO